MGDCLTRITRMSVLGRKWLATLEGGYRLSAYQCPAGIWTISAGVTRYPALWGYGRSNRRVEAGDAVSAADAELLFDRALIEYELAVDDYTRDDISQPEFDALVAFAYNAGKQGLRTSTLLRRVNERAGDDEVAAQFRRWVKSETDASHPGLETVEGLVNRREAEIKVFTRGHYTDQSGHEVRV